MMKEKRFDLTEAQHNYLRPLVAQGQVIQQQIQAFLEYVAAENKLPKPEDGWKLKFESGSDLPKLVGMIKEPDQYSFKGESNA